MNKESKIVGSPKENEPWDVVIIGSGPSGLTASIYTTRGAATTLILGGEKWGGQLMQTTEVDNFPGSPGIQGPDLMQKMRDHATMFGAEFMERNADEISYLESESLFTVKVSSDLIKAKSIIVATGAETLWLGVPGEEKLRGRGVSSCAPCDAPFFRDKNVVVIGGGDSAMEEALVLAKYATSVTMIHRRDEFKASQAMQQKAITNPKINIIWGTEVIEFVGENVLSSIKFKTKPDSKHLTETKSKISEKLKGSIFAEDTTELNWEAPFEGAFVAIGHAPASSIFKSLIELDEKGYVKRLSDQVYKTKTSKEGIFVAGDIHDHDYRQAITASGFGCMAGMDVLKYLDKETPTW